jgi:hypothetical protein
MLLTLVCFVCYPLTPALPSSKIKKADVKKSCAPETKQKLGRETQGLDKHLFYLIQQPNSYD